MDSWGFETRTDLPGNGAGLFQQAQPPANNAPAGGGSDKATMMMGLAGGLAGVFLAADSAKNIAKTQANAQIQQSKIFADARKAEAQELGHTRRWEAMLFADAKETEARERTDGKIAEARFASETRIAEASERADAVKHLSDNEVKVSRHQNTTAWLMGMANSRDSQMLAQVMKEMNSEKLDTKLGIAFKDADVRLAEIRSQERTAEGEHKVQTREVDARIAEAHRPESVGSDGLLA